MVIGRRAGFACIALSELLAGSLGVTTKAVLHVATTNALSIALLRALIALPLLVVINALRLGWNAFHIARRDLGIMVLAGLLMALYQVGFVAAIALVNVTVATLVALCTAPVGVAILSRVLLGERLRPGILTALACAIAGVVLLVGVQPLAGVGPSTWL